MPPRTRSRPSLPERQSRGSRYSRSRSPTGSSSSDERDVRSRSRSRSPRPSARTNEPQKGGAAPTRDELAGFCDTISRMSWKNLREAASIVRELVVQTDAAHIGDKASWVRSLDTALDEAKPNRREVCRMLAQALEYENFHHPPPRRAVDDLIQDEELSAVTGGSERFEDSLTNQMMLDPVRPQPFAARESDFVVDRNTWKNLESRGLIKHPLTREKVTHVEDANDVAEELSELLRGMGVDLETELRIRDRADEPDVIFDFEEMKKDFESALDNMPSFTEDELRRKLKELYYEPVEIEAAVETFRTVTLAKRFTIIGPYDEELHYHYFDVDGKIYWQNPCDPDDFRALKVLKIGHSATAWFGGEYDDPEDIEDEEWHSHLSVHALIQPGEVDPRTGRFRGGAATFYTAVPIAGFSIDNFPRPWHQARCEESDDGFPARRWFGFA